MVFKGTVQFYFEVSNKRRLLFLIFHDAPAGLVDAGFAFRQVMVSHSTCQTEQSPHLRQPKLLCIPIAFASDRDVGCFWYPSVALNAGVFTLP